MGCGASAGHTESGSGQWQTGIRRFESANGYFPRSWYVHLSSEINGKKLWRKGDFIKFRGLPKIFVPGNPNEVEFDPNDMWYDCDSESKGTPHFNNPGIQYDANKVGVAWGCVVFLAKRKEEMTPDELVANGELLAQTAAKHRARLQAEKDALDSTAMKFHTGWHSGVTNLYSANGYFPRNWYCHLSPDVPGDAVWKKGDFIMFKGLPPMPVPQKPEEVEFDPNGIWFSCDSNYKETPHFDNPGVEYNAEKFGVVWSGVLFTARRRDSFTAKELRANAELMIERSAKTKARLHAKNPSEKVSIVHLPPLDDTPDDVKTLSAQGSKPTVESSTVDGFKSLPAQDSKTTVETETRRVGECIGETRRGDGDDVEDSEDDDDDGEVVNVACRLKPAPENAITILPSTRWEEIIPARSFLEELEQNTSIRDSLPKADAIIADVKRKMAELPYIEEAKEVIKNMDESELAAILAYTHDLNSSDGKKGNFFFELNNSLRDRQAAARQSMMSTWGVCVHYLLKGLSKLPDADGVLIRGLPNRSSIIQEYKIGRPIQWGAFVSVTTSMKAAKGFSDKKDGVIVKINGTRAKKLGAVSFFPSEEEAVLSPNATFTVCREASKIAGWWELELVQQSGDLYVF